MLKVAANVESITAEPLEKEMVKVLEHMVVNEFITVELQEKEMVKADEEFINDEQEQRIPGLLILRNIIKLIPIYLIRKLCQQLEPAIKF
jgi:hypothetical protein